jgi:hypothetical protein
MSRPLATKCFSPSRWVPVWFMNSIFWPLTFSVSRLFSYHTFGLSYVGHAGVSCDHGWVRSYIW